MKKNKLTRLIGKWKPYDFTYNLLVEQELFRKQSIYFEKSQIALNNDRCAHLCRLLVKLLDIVLECDNALELVSESIWEERGNLLEMKSPGTFKHRKYVNFKNSSRFMPNYPTNTAIAAFALRQQKAWYLYNKLRYYIMQELWD